MHYELNLTFFNIFPQFHSFSISGKINFIQTFVILTKCINSLLTSNMIDIKKTRQTQVMGYKIISQ